MGEDSLALRDSPNCARRENCVGSEMFAANTRMRKRPSARRIFFSWVGIPSAWLTTWKSGMRMPGTSFLATMFSLSRFFTIGLDG